MEEKKDKKDKKVEKNKTIEKVEKIVSKPKEVEKKKTIVTKQAEENSPVKKAEIKTHAVVIDEHEKSKKAKNNKKAKKSQKAEKFNKVKISKEEKSRKKEMIKLERQKLKAGKKLQMEKLKSERKAEKERNKNAKAIAWDRKKAEIKKRIATMKAERQKRKELLKHESKIDRRRRKDKEREAKVIASREKREMKKEKRRLHAEKVAESRKSKWAEKSSKRKDNKRSVSGGMIGAVISLSVSLLVISSAFATYFFVQRDSDMRLENMYRKSFNDLYGYVDNMEVNLSKLMIANTKTERLRLLQDLGIEAELAESNINQLPIEQIKIEKTTKFINQVGDYSKYLTRQVMSGKKLTVEDEKIIENFYKTNLSLRENLAKISKLKYKKSFFEMFKKFNPSDNPLVSEFSKIENSSMNYPKLIYDGPFSDSIENKVAKGLSGAEISKTDAEKLVKEYFASYDIKELKYLGEGFGTIHTFNFNIKTSNGKDIFAELTKVGGKLLTFDSYDNCKDKKINDDESIKIAEKFLNNLGFENMKAVWASENGTVCNINFVSISDGKVLYPDMVKVKVCMEKGIVTGIEALPYFLNHTARKMENPQLKLIKARQNVSSKLDIEAERMVVIPKGNSSEVLCYEFMGKYNNITYYVYINANNGEEEDVFRVVETTEGKLLI